MTIPMDSALSVTAGHVFAVAGREAIREDPEKARACLRRSRLFQALVAVPVGVYFWLRWPDWSWMYVAGKRSRSPALAAVGLSVYMLGHELGYRNAARLIRAGRADDAVIQGAASLSLLALVSAGGWRRFRWQGTTADFEGGTATDVLYSRDFQVSMLLAGAVVAAAALAVIKKNNS